MALRILETGLHAFLVDLVDAAGRAQVDIAHDAGLSAKHVSQMLNGRVDGSLTAWTKVLRAAYVIPPGEYGTNATHCSHGVPLNEPCERCDIPPGERP